MSGFGGIAAAVGRLGTGRLRVGVVGTGISGLLAARLLSARHDVTVFEADDRIGGHTHTIDVAADGVRAAVDTGFIVFNERNYPGFTRVLRRLGVASRPTTMSFSYHSERTGLEYCGGPRLATLFAQRRNLLRPSFWGMLRDILRFHRAAPQLLAEAGSASVAEMLYVGRYGEAFVEHYLTPMAAAIWSAEPAQVLQMPARFLVRFFHNHGMLQVHDRPQWRTVVGGSREYLGPLAAPFQSRVRLRSPVERIERQPDGVRVSARGAAPERFDAVVVAAHSDQALRMLADPSDEERAVLGAIRYQANDVVLHTDARAMPVRRRAWAAWNYRAPRDRRAGVAVTYCMNLLQGLPERPPLLVTLNSSGAIDPDRVLRRLTYHHPLFDSAAVRAQARVPDINGSRRVWYCGAWCGYGFHEDGVAAALMVARDFGLSLDDLDSARAGVGQQVIA